MRTTSRTVKRGSGNVFADIGVPAADLQFMKARLVSRIQDAIDARGMTQAEAAMVMGIGQPDVSRMLRGNFRDVSVERLLRFLQALGYAIDIIVRQPGRKASGDKISLRPAEAA